METLTGTELLQAILSEVRCISKHLGNSEDRRKGSSESWSTQLNEELRRRMAQERLSGPKAVVEAAVRDFRGGYSDKLLANALDSLQQQVDYLRNRLDPEDEHLGSMGCPACGERHGFKTCDCGQADVPLNCEADKLYFCAICNKKHGLPMCG